MYLYIVYTIQGDNGAKGDIEHLYIMYSPKRHAEPYLDTATNIYYYIDGVCVCVTVVFQHYLLKIYTRH